MALLAMGMLGRLNLERALGRMFVVALALSRPWLQELDMGVLCRPVVLELYMEALGRPLVQELYMGVLGRPKGR